MKHANNICLPDEKITTHPRFILSTFREFDISIERIGSGIFTEGELILCNFELFTH